MSEEVMLDVNIVRINFLAVRNDKFRMDHEAFIIEKGVPILMNL